MIAGEYGSDACSRSPEASGARFGEQACGTRIILDSIAPGRPMGNGLIERFNGRLRDECLSMHWFESLEEARRVIERCRVEHSDMRQHSSLGTRAPAVYVAELLGVSAGSHKR